MDDWAYRLAKEIKKDRSKPVTGVCIGDVISTSPFLVTIQNGAFILDASNSYVCNQILERNTTYKAKGKMQQEGQLNASCPISSHDGYSATCDYNLQGDIELDAVWKPGDKVLVIPTEDGQTFFIVDIIKGVT